MFLEKELTCWDLTLSIASFFLSTFRQDVSGEAATLGPCGKKQKNESRVQLVGTWLLTPCPPESDTKHHNTKPEQVGRQKPWAENSPEEENLAQATKDKEFAGLTLKSSLQMTASLWKNKVFWCKVVNTTLYLMYGQTLAPSNSRTFPLKTVRTVSKQELLKHSFT